MFKLNTEFALGCVQETFKNILFETRNFSIHFHVLCSLVMDSIIWSNSWMVQCSNRNLEETEFCPEQGNELRYSCGDSFLPKTVLLLQ